MRETSTPAEQFLALIPRLSAEEILSLPNGVSTYAAISVGKIITKKTSEAE